MIHVSTLESPRQTAWVCPPGVVYGCEVIKGSGISLTINPGRAFTANGTTLDIRERLTDHISVSACQAYDRIDYVAVNADRRSGFIKYVKGIERPNYNSEDAPDNENRELVDKFLALNDGAILAKLLVQYPTVGPESIFIFNAIPGSGEFVMNGVPPLESPDGIRRQFTFPVPAAQGLAINLSVFGLAQTEGVDYTYVTDRAKGVAIVTVDEAVPSNEDIYADIYSGLVSYYK